MLRRVLLLLTSLVLAGAGTIGASAVQAAPAKTTPDQTVSTQLANAGPCPYGEDKAHPQLSQGSKGEAVVHLQCLLYRVWKYKNVDIDGDFGPDTLAAVKAHQKDCHIKRDGIVGPKTWTRLHPNSTTAECRDAGRG